MNAKFVTTIAALILMTGTAFAQGTAAPAAAADSYAGMSCQAMMDKADKMMPMATSLQKRRAQEAMGLARNAIIRSDEASCKEHMATALNDMK